MADNVTYRADGSVPGNTTVSTRDIGGAQVQIVDLLYKNTAFGELRVAPLMPVAQLEFPYNINTEIAKTAVTGSGSVTAASGLVSVSTTAAASSTASLSSRLVLNYSPGQGSVVRFAGLFTTGVANSTQLAGVGDANDGFFFGYNGATFGVLRRHAGEDSWIAQSAWNVDIADGNGELPLINPTKGNVYQINYQWLGFGAITFSIENPATGEIVPVHVIQYANANVLPSISNPSLPLNIYAANTTNETAITVKMSSMGAFVEGFIVDIGAVFAQSNLKTGLSTTRTNVITYQNKATYISIANRVAVRLLFLSVSSDGTKNGLIELVRDTTLGGTPSYTDINATNSVISYDTAGTTLTGGLLLMSIPIGKIESNVIDLSPYNFLLMPGEKLTIAYTADGTAANDIRASLTWRELL